MTFAEYLDIDAWNWSLLKEGKKSARHIAHRKAQPREDTTSLKVGRAAHTAILEPHKFEAEFAVWDGDRRGKAFAAFAEQHPEQTILRLTEYEACLGMRNAVRAHPVASGLLARGDAEVALLWTDEETGLACKARIDWLGDDCLVDLKTTSDVEPIRFGITAGRMGYHGQLAFYLRGLKAKGLELPAKIVAVESAAPHDVAVFALSEDDLWLGDCEVSRLLKLVAECKERNEWPGSCPGETPLILPAWMFKQAADEDDGFDALGLVAEAQEA